MKTMNWFSVDKVGLEKLLSRRGKSFVLFELIQNAWDEKVTKVSVSLELIPNTRKAMLVVEDDSPDGFADITHAYTLFAESKKRKEAERRGRFNFGEKLVLACCESAVIETVGKRVTFNSDGERKVESITYRNFGSKVMCVLRNISRKDIEDILNDARKLIPPAHIQTVINGVPLKQRKPICSFEETLATELSDEEGNVRPTRRQTIVEIYEPEFDDEEPMIYEMGIPIVETGDKYHVNVLQKVPLTLDRDNVPPSYLQAIRTFTLNVTFDLLKKDEAVEPWVRAGASDDRCVPHASQQVMTLRFGEKRVAFDPSDPEANNIATAAGYAVVHGGSLSKGEWGNAKKFSAILPAGQVTPSQPKGLAMARTLSPDEHTDGMKRVKRLCKTLANELMEIDVTVLFISCKDTGTVADYGSKTLRFNVYRLGNAWFDLPNNREAIVDLIIHEFGHEYEGNHLSRNYYHALTRLAGAAVELALTKPEVFN